MIWYLASPYTKFARGQDAAFSEAAKATAKLMAAGLVVYSPIAHSHPVATHGNLDALDGAFWLRQNMPMMERMDGIIVLKLPGWRESEGVKFEIDFFRREGKDFMWAESPLDENQAAELAWRGSDRYSIIPRGRVS